jgi:hypothetical protein
MNPVFEILENKDLLRKDKISLEALTRLTKKRLLDLIQDLACCTPPTDRTSDKHQLAHSAALSLAGGREECASIGCRMRRLNSLARFAALYRDKVYIPNYFASYEHFKTLTERELIHCFYDDLLLLSFIRPVMDVGLVEFMGGQEHACPNCIARIGFGHKSGLSLKKALSGLASEYLNNTQFSLEKRQNRFLIHLKGLEPYYNHGGLFYDVDTIPEFLKSNTMLMSKLQQEGVLSLSKTNARKFPYHKYMAQEVAMNINYQVIMKYVLDTHFITDRDIHIVFLQRLTHDEQIARRNLLAYKHMTALVPFLEDVPLPKLLKLRQREREAFLQFRAAVNKSIDEFLRTKEKLSEQDAKSIYSDIIAPGLARLDKSVEASKKDLIASVIRSGTGALGAITFGLYTGIIPYEIAGIAKALGFVKFASDIIQKVMSLGDGEKTVQQEDLYFLWKVKQKANKH